MGPIFFPRKSRQRKESFKEKSERIGSAEHGCPMGFVRPDGESRCAWKKTGPRTPVDLAAMKQGPHSFQQPRERCEIMPDVLHAIGNTPMVRINRISKSAGLKCELSK
jgi:cystathionine beta-synthase